MAKHQAPEPHPVRDRAALRTVALAMIGLTLFVLAMVASYSGAFAKPALHHMSVAVAGPQQLVDGIRGQETLAVNEVGDAAAARQEVYERKADAAFVVAPTGEMTIYTAGGGGKSVATAAETVGRTVAAKAGLPATVEDVAPPSAGDPSGTVEFYAVIFISIGASVGATVLGRLMGTVRRPLTLALRTATLTGFSALLAGAVTVYVDVILGALTGHTWQVFGALWLYAMAVAGAITGVAAAFGSVASMALTAFLVVIGNAAAAGPVGRQGSGVSLLRSVSYFSGNGAQTPLLTLAVWGAAGCMLAVGATASRVNYRATYDRFVGRDRALLRPGVLSPADRDAFAAGSGVVRPRDGLGVCVQPRRGNSVLRPRP
jgi:hypothetical protein